MKRNIVLFGIIIMLAFTFDVHSQPAREEKKKEKAENAASMKVDSINNESLKIMVESQAFVLEANTLYDRSGQSFILNSTTNFVGFDRTIAKMEVIDDKNGYGFTINVTVRQQAGGTVTMIFIVSSDGNARVDRSGTFGEKLTYQGKIVSLAEAYVYKGTSLF